MKFWILPLIIFLSGCQSNEIACNVKSDQKIGRGIIINSKEVLTVVHVAKPEEHLQVEGHPAHITITKIEPGWTDGLAVLEIDDPEFQFPAARFATFAPYSYQSQSLFYLSKHGKEVWPFGIYPGDSGSPIVNEQNQVVGIVRAVKGEYLPVKKIGK